MALDNFFAQASTAKRQERPWRENLNYRLICHECKEDPPNIVEDFSSGDTVCDSCGLVLGARIVDTASEWRTFSNDNETHDDPSRVGDGADPLFNGSQLQTLISSSSAGMFRPKSRDLQRAHNKSTNTKSTKVLISVYREIDALYAGMQIPQNVTETAKHLFKLVEGAKGAFKGKPQDTIIAGCIFIACRKCKVPRTFKEIFSLTKVSKSEIGRIFKLLERFFAAQNRAQMESVVQAGGKCSSTTKNPTKPVAAYSNTCPKRDHQPNEAYTTTRSAKASDLCVRFCSQLRLGANVVSVAQALCDKTGSCGTLCGRSPLSVAGACIFMASKLLGVEKSPKQIEAVAGVTANTLMTIYKVMINERAVFPQGLDLDHVEKKVPNS